ncbi:MAG: hypothetical protein AAFQ80_06755 [Cyanobacteria bacterium J06621_8]
MNTGKKSSSRVSRSARRRHQSYRGLTAEINLKLILSWAIAIAAIASLFRLLPYHLRQQAKLKELRIQVEATEARVNELRGQLNHNFAPERTQGLMEQYSTLIAPNQSRIYWLPEDVNSSEVSD